MTELFDEYCVALEEALEKALLAQAQSLCKDAELALRDLAPASRAAAATRLQPLRARLGSLESSALLGRPAGGPLGPASAAAGARMSAATDSLAASTEQLAAAQVDQLGLQRHQAYL